MISRRWLSVLLSLTVSSSAFAGVGGRTPEQMSQLIDQYVSEMRKTTDGALAEAGRGEFLAEAVTAQVTALEPEDFNLFLLRLVDRYVNHPEERKIIGDFTQVLREGIAADLENTKDLNEGPLHSVLSGTFNYVFWILIGGAVLKQGVLPRLPGAAAFTAQLSEREALLMQKGRLYALPYKTLKHPWVLSAGAGAGLGYLNYVLETHKTHRLDPQPIFSIVQADLACHISYRALELMERYSKAKDRKDEFVKQHEELLVQARDLSAQSQVLLDQYSQLANLDVKDRLFQQNIGQLPPAQSWQEFRKNLSEADTSKDGQCRQMSLTMVKIDLDKISDEISAEFPSSEDMKP